MNANYNGDPAISALTDNRALDQLFACPACHAGLHILADQTLHCQAEGYFFQQVDGIWRFLLSTRQEYYQQFIQEYEAIRRAGVCAFVGVRVTDLSSCSFGWERALTGIQSFIHSRLTISSTPVSA